MLGACTGADGEGILSSLPYQVLLVFGGWFYVVFAAVELFLFLFKGMSLPYPKGNMASEVCLLTFTTVVESVRLSLGKRGNLTERSPCVLLSLLLTVPAALSSVYFLLWQTYVLRLDVVLAAVQLGFQALQSLFALSSVLAFGK
ncbi:transmembrane protein, putative [Ixodes scapularis]|uniref:Transmembrane protein, putative n=1 Tax=Ixodes scapularis TaxID=6945 RepID=B7QIP3_IXOSC|nr:transmembrane protein, putative [Ixodes scapularis]|eukprot:XP_002415050.1 transmembrane protein, putative [Ixodes scapularis]